jgi:hypothetical protein
MAISKFHIPRQRKLETVVVPRKYHLTHASTRLLNIAVVASYKQSYLRSKVHSRLPVSPSLVEFLQSQMPPKAAATGSERKAPLEATDTNIAPPPATKKREDCENGCCCKW